MSQIKFNNLLVLQIHKEKTDALNLAEVGNVFVSAKDIRLNVFGKYE